MMARTFTPKVVTANALIEGDVIYLTGDGRWSRHLSQAELLTDEARAEARLALAQAAIDRVVGAYLTDVQAGPNGPAPVHFREEFRRTGPSNYPHGKQVELENV